MFFWTSLGRMFSVVFMCRLLHSAVSLLLSDALKFARWTVSWIPSALRDIAFASCRVLVSGATTSKTQGGVIHFRKYDAPVIGGGNIEFDTKGHRRGVEVRPPTFGKSNRG